VQICREPIQGKPIHIADLLPEEETAAKYQASTCEEEK